MRARDLDYAIASTGGRVQPIAASLAQAASIREAIEQDERDMAVVYARSIRHRAALAHALASKKGRHAVMELAGTAKIGQDRSTTQLEIAVRLEGNFPRVLELLEEGRLFRGTVDMLATITRHTSTPVQIELGLRLGDKLVGLDAVDARELIVQTLLEAEADLGREEHEERLARARSRRGVWVKPVGDGMTRIGAEVDDITAQRWLLDFEELIRAQKVADDRAGVERTAQQRRADVFGEAPGRQIELIRAMQRGEVEVVAPEEQTERAAELLALPLRDRSVLNIHIPVTTTLGLDNCPARIEGAGPVESGQIQVLFPIAKVRRVFVDATTGAPIAMDAHLQPPLVELDPDPHSGSKPTARAHTKPTARAHTKPTVSAGTEPIAPPGAERTTPSGTEPIAPPGAQPIAPPGAERTTPSGTEPSAPSGTRSGKKRTPRMDPDRLRLLLRATLHSTVPEPQHDPSAALQRLVRARDLGCLGPGCPTPARQCQLDHLIEYGRPGGVTSAPNLDDLSTGCHLNKHDGWHVERLPDGTTVWHSPLGGVYERRPRWLPPPLFRRETWHSRNPLRNRWEPPAPKGDVG